MIQHHLIYHFTSLEDGNTYYEANPQAAYYLVRSGKILQLVEDRLGEYAARVMEAILYLGHASVKELEGRPELRSRKPVAADGIQHDEEEPQENGMDAEEEPAITNGDHGMEDKPAPFHATLKALASHGYILRVRDAHFQSPADNLLEAQRAVGARSDIKALKGKKQEEAIREKAQELVEERTNGDLTQGLMFNGLPRGIKRKFGNGSAKEQRQNGQNGVNGDHAEDEEEEENEWSEDEDGFDNIPLEVSI
jgi:DNA-directed RNA polymerase III subunit RPC3